MNYYRMLNLIYLKKQCINIYDFCNVHKVYLVLMEQMFMYINLLFFAKPYIPKEIRYYK